MDAKEHLPMQPFLLAAALVAAMTGSACARAQAIQVVTEANQYTYVRDGKVAGPATQIVEATLKGAGLDDYRIGMYPWARAWDMATHDPNVLIYLIGRTPAREGQFKWVGDFVKMEYHFYKLKDREDIVVKSLQDAKNYTIGALRNDVRHDYLRTQGFTKLVISGQVLDNFKKLLTRQVQLIPISDGLATAMCEEAKFDCSQLEKVLTLDELSVDLYMAFSMSTPDSVAERARSAFQKLKADGTVARLMSGKP